MGVIVYRELDIWKKSMDLCEEIYKITKNFPKEELYSLVTQMRRAAVSISSNIAEGFARKSNPDFKRFLRMAQGSLTELETHLEIANRLNYIALESVAGLFENSEILGKMMTRFIQNMRK